ncbi:hypothetical protein MTR_0015s0120 [Medicago truncatula]|uniref:RNase H type-1 domain-containing protein n=1 Tax=Medicago truncatula TaxID=3880 RepID=A0A072TIS3_MEDTR|nr:hypothetical protein MTR_0015s0120 [Medicago truncatula]
MLLGELGINNRRRISRFKFENAWLADLDFNNFVTDKLNSYGSYPIVDKLDLFASDLSDWSKNKFNNLKRDIDMCRKQIDRMRSQASGQAVNLQKYEIFCSRNVSNVVHNNIANILGVQAVLGTGKYLGLPSMIGRRTFNLAMLGKQGWRIMTNPESLIARIYKARYYPRCNFFEATLVRKCGMSLSCNRCSIRTLLNKSPTPLYFLRWKKIDLSRQKKQMELFDVNHFKVQGSWDLLWKLQIPVLDGGDAALFCCLLWSIWKQRNNKIRNEMAETFEGRFKCNIDASFSRHLNKIGIDICIRDDSGTFVLAKTEWISPLCDVHVGETLGLLSALEWVHKLQLRPIDFELDAKRVVDNFLSTNNDVT